MSYRRASSRHQLPDTARRRPEARKSEEDCCFCNATTSAERLFELLQKGGAEGSFATYSLLMVPGGRGHTVLGLRILAATAEKASRNAWEAALLSDKGESLLRDTVAASWPDRSSKSRSG